MSEQDPTVPFGYCHCGCGRKTTIAKEGSGKGRPNRWLKGHFNRIGPRDRYLVDPTTGCWVWQHAKDPNGYGRGSRASDGEWKLAHRVVYEEAHGPIPDGMSLDHLCRNTSCVNPAHLEPVSHAENCRRGNATKLTWEDVRAIRASSELHRVLSARYGVSGPAISNIKNYKRWKEESVWR